MRVVHSKAHHSDRVKTDSNAVGRQGSEGSFTRTQELKVEWLR